MADEVERFFRSLKNPNYLAMKLLVDSFYTNIADRVCEKGKVYQYKS